ncbi:pentapeptide repeat-containing protein, partial [Paraburkholderia sp. RL17-373-BIF-A]|uniref:pentapeptide repeat-containing protein n=1 Tax=Paraburkholderia sp. RL17-373-BIF-A TaxID=3031629 RepID=UPI0038B92D55
MSAVTAQTFARAFLGKSSLNGSFAGGTHEAFRQGPDGKNVPTFSREVFRRVTATAEESMAKQAGDFDISRSRGTVTATITLLTAFIGLLIERVCKSISSHQKEDAVTQAVVDLHEKILGENFAVQRAGNRSVSVGLKHGGELEVSEDTDGNGTVLTITVRTGATSESFAIEDGTIDDLRAVLEQEIVRHEADHYRYREAAVRIPPVRRNLLGGGKVDLSGVDLRGVDLSRANLSGANLSGATLHQTTFSLGALLRHSDKFSDEMLSGIVFAGLSEDLSRPVVRDLFFNHRNNPDSGSILTAIDTRLKGDNKLRCMELAIRALDDAISAG